MTDTDRIAQMAREADCLDGNGDILICDAEAALRFARVVAEDCATVCGWVAKAPRNTLDEPRTAYFLRDQIRARYSKEG